MVKCCIFFYLINEPFWPKFLDECHVTKCHLTWCECGLGPLDLMVWWERKKEIGF